METDAASVNVTCNDTGPEPGRIPLITPLESIDKPMLEGCNDQESGAVPPVCVTVVGGYGWPPLPAGSEVVVMTGAGLMTRGNVFELLP